MWNALKWIYYLKWFKAKQIYSQLQDGMRIQNIYIYYATHMLRIANTYNRNQSVGIHLS